MLFRSFNVHFRVEGKISTSYNFISIPMYMSRYTLNFNICVFRSSFNRYWLRQRTIFSPESYSLFTTNVSPNVD